MSETLEQEIDRAVAPLGWRLLAGAAVLGGVIACAWALWPPKKKKNPKKFKPAAAKRELAAFARKERRRELGKRVKGERARARDELTSIRVACEAGRAELREQRAELAAGCKTARESAGARGRERVGAAKAARATYLEGERERVASERRARGPALRRSAAEARAEKDDEVRANLPLELVPVFDAVRRSIEAGPRQSRTEAFLEWAEAHPEEVLDLQAQQAEADVDRWVREWEGAA